jgi:hypothetical protein
MKQIKKIGYLVLFAFFFIGCDKETTVPQEEETTQEEGTTPRGAYDLGILITNEGPFQTGSGSVSYISEDYQTVNQNIYNAVNGENLGNIVQSMSFYGDLAYIVVNNSNRIVVVNRYTFEKIAVIESDLEQPRYLTIVNNKGYVSNWGDPFIDTDDFIAVIDLDTNIVTQSIPVDFGPEKMVVASQKLYVAHQGGFGFNNKISVINTINNVLTTTITVGDVPNSLTVFGDDLLVLCGGKPAWADSETAGSLVAVDLTTNTISQSLDFPTITDHPTSMSRENSDMYYVLNNNVYKMDIAAGVLPQNPIITNVSFYAMTIHNQKLYGTDAGDFQSNGFLNVYDLSTNALLENLEVGIIPNGVYFNEQE